MSVTMDPQTRTDEEVELFLTLDEASSVESQIPEVAIAHFRDLSRESDPAIRLFALEQRGKMAWSLGIYGEAEQAFRQLVEETEAQPEQAYLQARAIVRLAEILFGPAAKAEQEMSRSRKETPKVDPQIVSWLEKAERIFELNNDRYMVGKVGYFKSVVSGRQGDLTKARKQAKRSRRIMDIHGPLQGVTDKVIQGTQSVIFGGSQN